MDNVIYINGKSIDVKKISINDLKNYLEELQNMKKATIERQNEYLSELLQ